MGFAHQMKGKRLCGFGRGHADAPAKAIEGCWATNRKPVTRRLPGCPSREILRGRCRRRTWRSCGALRQVNASGFAAIVHFLAPEFTMDAPQGVESSQAHDRARLQEWFRKMDEIWEGLTFDPIEISALDPERGDRRRANLWPWQRQRDGDRPDADPPLDPAGRKGDSVRRVLDEAGGPRSRRAAGVGAISRPTPTSAFA